MTTPSRNLLTLVLTDQGGVLRNGEGAVIGELPQVKGQPRVRGALAESLREWAPAGSEIQLLLSHGDVNLHCQDAPFLSRREFRGVAERMALTDGAAVPMATAAVLDPDPTADGGHVLWIATHPKAGMDAWAAEIQSAGLRLLLASPLERVVLRSLEEIEGLPKELAVLAIEGGSSHLFFFRGRSLVGARSFELSGSDDERDERVYEEASRFLQFFKQKQRNLVISQLVVIGLPVISTALQNRLQSALRIQAKCVAPTLWPLLQRGLHLERHRHGLNLVPVEIQELEKRRLLRGVVWAAATVTLAILVILGFFLQFRVSELRKDVEQARANLAVREAMANQVDSVVQARLPLLRVRAGEQRQADSIRALAQISALLLSPPEGVVLEKVEVLEVSGAKPAHAFTVSGTALTTRDFSVGPLARYLATLSAASGVHLSPLKEVSVSDRVLEGKDRIDQKAVTRFFLEGRVP